MKKRKTFLAKVLAAAIAVTAVLPGAMTAQARWISSTESVADALESKTWIPAMESGNVGGETGFWTISTDVNANGNTNDDYTQVGRPAVLIDWSRAVTFEDEAKTISTLVQPAAGASGVSTMRIGIMLMYVDGTHWAYLNWDSGRWLFEYKCDSYASYTEAISELPAMADNTGTRVDLTYKNETVNGDVQKKISAVVQTGTGVAKSYPFTGNIPGKSYTYETLFAALETYAANKEVTVEGTDDEGNSTTTTTTGVPVRYGIKAATGVYNDGRKVPTTVNLKNMTFAGVSMLDDDWQFVRGKDETATCNKNGTIGGVNYSVVNASESQSPVVSAVADLTDFKYGTVSAVLMPKTEAKAFALDARYVAAGEGTEESKVSVGYDESGWYYIIGSEKTPITAENAPAVEKDSRYLLSMTLDRGKLTATVTPQAPEAAEQPEEAAQDETTEPEAVTLCENVAVSEDIAAGSVAVEAAAGSSVWVKNLTYTKETLTDPTDLVNAVDSAKKSKGENNDANKYFTDKWTEYQTALTAAEDFISGNDKKSAAEVNTLKTNLTTKAEALKEVAQTSEYQALDTLYKSVKDEEQGYYDNTSWKNFTDARDAAKAILDKAGKEALTVADVTGATTALTTAKNDRVERPATTEEKAGLQEAFDKVKDTENKCYTEASWTTFTNALAAAEEALKAEDVNNTEVAEKLEALNAAFAGLTAQTATAEDVQNMKASYDSVKATANDNYTKESWDAFQAALKNVEAVIAKGEDATQYEVQDVLKKLEDAKAALKKNAPVNNGNNNNNNNNKPEAKIPAVGETTVLKGVTYKVTKSDAANGTVSVSKADKNTKKVTIPSTVTIGEVTFKVTAVDAKAFAGCKKLTSVTIGANVASIGKQAFSKCTKLKKVIFKGTKAPKIGAKAFQKTAKKCVVTTPKKMAKKQLKKLKTSLKKAGMKSAVYKKK